nr:serine/threonine-protein kinase crk1 [Quercus suber]
MATSPALDVPPEPPLKRQKVNGESRPIDTNAETTLPPTADLAEQLDHEERSKYVKGKKLGSGQYADVFSAHLVSDPSKLVAIKKIKVGPEWADFGISFDSLREIRFLQELDHPNIIKMHAVFSTNTQNLNLVLEQLPQGDMLKLINDTSVSYTPADIKAWMLMLCRAVWFCHANYVLHRDIKPNNLLIAADGEIKLADFGLARSFADPFAEMTYNTITLWYRPPELFYQSRYYGGAVDVWSVGCVFAEFIQRRPLFQAIPESELRMVQLISEGVGTPTEDNWPGVSKLRGYIAPTEITPVHSKAHWLSHFRSIGDNGVDLLMKMLTLDPRHRPTAEGALMHEYWTSEPRPSKLEHLPKKGGGLEAMGEELRKRGGEIPDGKEKKAGNRAGRGDGVARKIDFGNLRN